MKALFAVAALLLVGCSYLAPRDRAAGPSAVEEGIKFRFFHPNATRVQLGGDWPENNWARGDGAAGEANIGLMTNNHGIWEIVVDLPPGRYRYAFWVDESSWQVDPANPEQVPADGPTSLASQLLVVSRNGRIEIR